MTMLLKIKEIIVQVNCYQTEKRGVNYEFWN